MNKLLSKLVIGTLLISPIPYQKTYGDLYYYRTIKDNYGQDLEVRYTYQPKSVTDIEYFYKELYNED